VDVHFGEQDVSVHNTARVVGGYGSSGTVRAGVAIEVDRQRSSSKRSRTQKNSTKKNSHLVNLDKGLHAKAGNHTTVEVKRVERRQKNGQVKTGVDIRLLGRAHVNTAGRQVHTKVSGDDVVVRPIARRRNGRVEGGVEVEVTHSGSANATGHRATVEKGPHQSARGRCDSRCSPSGLPWPRTREAGGGHSWQSSVHDEQEGCFC